MRGETVRELADAILAEHRGSENVGAFYCVVCRDVWPCKPMRFASLFVRVDTATDVIECYLCSTPALDDSDYCAEHHTVDSSPA